MDHKAAATMFKALGDPTRLRIYTFLCGCCCPVALDEGGDECGADGPTVGDVCCRITGVGKITSTISFHLKELRNAGLITMEKRGKNVVCGVDREAMRSLGVYLDDTTGCACSCPQCKENR